ncbi:hypothetical protein TL16_g10189 [Triparma laevis f. inornata]|uniref:Uncharacterized protein n=2 Tax=Triparma laevis TaxID=1534972 RepID=A0A9W6ZLP5_9STRA|nr:hypothetical protein TrLO_g12194 [Triparma laevis f. longispina]GMH85308.1 hypothetical protein TL16_g10189 [Triparma laevis f. inornata]
MREAIVAPVENCVTIHDLCKAFDLDASYYEYEKFGQEVTLKDPLYKFPDDTADEHTLMKTRIGPLKGYERALTKEKEGVEESGSEWTGLRDLNRVTFEFEGPLILTLVYKALTKKFKVSGLKNKFEDIMTTVYKQPPDIHMNIDLGLEGNPGWLVEVQLMFASILTVKKELHKFYNVVRARFSEPVLDPLFSLADTLSKQVEGEKKDLKKTLASIKMADQLNSELTTSGHSNSSEALEKALAELKKIKAENASLKKMMTDAVIQFTETLSVD